LETEEEIKKIEEDDNSIRHVNAPVVAPVNEVGKTIGLLKITYVGSVN